jgi:subtilisin family serine protease
MSGAPSFSSPAAFELLEPRRLLSSLPWGAQAIQIAQDQAAAKYPWVTGAGQTIAMIDAGIDYRHPALGGGIGAGHKIVFGYDFYNGDADPIPDDVPANPYLPDEHGTATTGQAAGLQFTDGSHTYQGVAPGAQVVALRAGPTGVKAALDWVVQHHAQYNIVAVNLMGNGPSNYRPELRQLARAGVFIGSPSQDNWLNDLNAGFPGLSPYIYYTGAVNAADQVSSFTERGEYLDMLAPGENVLAPYCHVSPSTHQIDSESITALSGTSEASPQTVGAAALLKQVDPALTPDAIYGILRDTGTPVFDPASNRTYPRLNLVAAIDAAVELAQSFPGAGPRPMNRTPFQATSPIEAENFDAGGEGIAYHVPDAADDTFVYRHAAANVAARDGASNGYAVMGLERGEWLDYSITLPQTGKYLFQARVLATGGGKIHFEVDGIRTKSVPISTRQAGWQNVSTRKAMRLSAGKRYVVWIAIDQAPRGKTLGDFDSFSLVGVG